ncbi:MAG: LpqB family beta-propeller domain-containing protein [Propionibacteriales bacterium]|nr:LpqB family beta-propeller domain-containing protein [Propionibacteriales bacterium]
MSRHTVVIRLLVGLVLAVLLGGCVALPTEGPVVERNLTDAEDARQASDIDARPPIKGASRTEVVSGFLDAMTAWPIQTSIAKKYLTDAAAAQWNPERETIVYGDTLPVREVGGAVSVELTAADSLDAVGGWRGPMPADQLTMDFRVTVEDGEYRIADPQDALVVPATWFQQRYRQVSLYYFDPLAQILVPEPVFVPEGDQLATSLVSGLLAGPPPLSRGVVRSFLPSGLSVGLSVPVDKNGVAQITLLGDAPKVTTEEAELMLAQLAWTLRQDGDITALRVTVGGFDLPLPGGASQYPVTGGQVFDPAGGQASTLLFGLSRGRLIWGTPGNLVPATGPFGDAAAGVVAVSARLDAERVAVVDRGGSRVRIGPVRQTANDVPTRTVLSGGTYARPSWDASGRLWVLERRSSGAVVWLVEGTRVRQVRVPGVTGERAQQLMVSRDGTRLVAVVRTGRGDEVVAARVVINGGGGVARARSAYVVHAAAGGRIIDMTWTSPIRIGLLTPTAPGALSEVDVVAADGATVGVDELSTVVSGELIGLAGSATEGSPLLAVYADRYVDIVAQDEYDAGTAMLGQLDYAG